ncbi:hypothetical protein BDY19DRAFT_997940 [Irpex rosettiformis]|uniref:Uncharacterized protein n=1 Tax=Irpex rosettiformis TaxID=378272 RepID=A0ACB8TQ36_9APHY|nr:hypothetical protein BDY19DRAFT_997940 [Irpex rosettiformis]
MAGARGRNKSRSSTSSKVNKLKNMKNSSSTKASEEKISDAEVEDKSSDEELLITSSKPKLTSHQIPEVLLTPRTKRRVSQAARLYVDEEAEEDDGVEESEESDEEDRAFIDDRDEEDLSAEDKTLSDEENSDSLEIRKMTPPPKKKTPRVIYSPPSPVESSMVVGSHVHAEKSVIEPPSIRPTSIRAKKVTSTQLTENEDSEDDVIEISKPTSSKKAKGKGRVAVHHISHKIAVAGTVPPGVKTTPVVVPIADAENNVFLDTCDGMDVDDVLEKEDTNQSPLKKAKTSSGTAVVTKVVSRKKTSEHDAVHDTPVTRVARVMAASNIASSDEGDEGASNDENHPPSAGGQASHPVEDQVSNVNNPNHRALMGRDMIDTYQDLLAPPCIRKLLSIAASRSLCSLHFQYVKNSTLEHVTLVPEILTSTSEDENNIGINDIDNDDIITNNTTVITASALLDLFARYRASMQLYHNPRHNILLSPEHVYRRFVN